MESRRIAGTDLTVSRVSFGTMTFGQQADEAASKEMLRIALDAGVVMLDTANIYTGGASETILGKLIEADRSKVLLATKVGNPKGSDGPPLRATEVRSSMLGSLQRLRTDHVDLFYLHRPDPATPLEETMGAMQELKDEGLTKEFGISNFASWQVAELAAIAERNGWHRVRFSQPVYSLVARRIEDEYLDATAYYGLANIVYNPLAGGMLTGKHRLEHLPDDGTRFSYNERYRRRYWNERQFESIQDFSVVAADAGISLIELSFRWLLSQDHVDSILVGASRPEQLSENLAACAKGPLTADVLKRCDEVWQDLGGSTAVHTK